MILDSPLKQIRAYLGSAAATTNPNFVSSWVDADATSTFLPGSNDGSFNGTTPVAIVSNPASAIQRRITYINIYNADTIAHNVSVELLNNATQRKMKPFTLGPGESVTYTEETGWVVFNNEGTPRTGGIFVNAGRIMWPPLVDVTANITGTKTITSTNTALVYINVAGRAASQIRLDYEITTAAATITWAELGVFKGTLPAVVGNPTLTRLGYLDVAAVINSTGRKHTVVTLTTNIAIGDEIWIGIGAQATTAPIIRAYSLVEDNQVGTVVMMVARPSTVASPAAWTVNNAVAPWMYAYLI